MLCSCQTNINSWVNNFEEIKRWLKTGFGYFFLYLFFPHFLEKSEEKKKLVVNFIRKIIHQFLGRNCLVRQCTMKYETRVEI